LAVLSGSPGFAKVEYVLLVIAVLKEGRSTVRHRLSTEPSFETGAGAIVGFDFIATPSLNKTLVLEWPDARIKD
jgi:hypothetical protein